MCSTFSRSESAYRNAWRRRGLNSKTCTCVYKPSNYVVSWWWGGGNWQSLYSANKTGRTSETKTEKHTRTHLYYLYYVEAKERKCCRVRISQIHTHTYCLYTPVIHPLTCYSFRRALKLSCQSSRCSSVPLIYPGHVVFLASRANWSTVAPWTAKHFETCLNDCANPVSQPHAGPAVFQARWSWHPVPSTNLATQSFLVMIVVVIFDFFPLGVVGTSTTTMMMMLLLLQPLLLLTTMVVAVAVALSLKLVTTFVMMVVVVIGFGPAQQRATRPRRVAVVGPKSTTSPDRHA